MLESGTAINTVRPTPPASPLPVITAITTADFVFPAPSLASPMLSGLSIDFDALEPALPADVGCVDAGSLFPEFHLFRGAAYRDAAPPIDATAPAVLSADVGDFFLDAAPDVTTAPGSTSLPGPHATATTGPGPDPADELGEIILARPPSPGDTTHGTASTPSASSSRAASPEPFSQPTIASPPPLAVRAADKPTLPETISYGGGTRRKVRSICGHDPLCNLGMQRPVCPKASCAMRWAARQCCSRCAAVP